MMAVVIVIIFILSTFEYVLSDDLHLKYFFDSMQEWESL